MFLIQLFVVALCACAILFIYFFGKGKVFKKYLLVLSVLLAIVFVFRVMLGRDRLEYVFDLDNSPFDSEWLTVISLILNWFSYATILLFILYPYFKNSRYLMLIKYFASVVVLLCVGFIYYNTIGIVGEEAYNSFSIRTILMGVEIGIMIGFAVVV